MKLTLRQIYTALLQIYRKDYYSISRMCIAFEAIGNKGSVFWTTEAICKGCCPLNKTRIFCNKFYDKSIPDKQRISLFIKELVKKYPFIIED